MQKIIARGIGRFAIACVMAAIVHLGTFFCHSQDEQKEEDFLSQLRGADDMKTSQALIAFLEGGGNPRLSLAEKNANMSKNSVETALVDSIHSGRLAIARKVAIFTLSNTGEIKWTLEGEFHTEWTFEAACLALWLCERYPEYPALVRSCWPKQGPGELKGKDKKSESLARFIKLYFADREKDPERQYIQIQLYLSSEEDPVLKAFLQQTAVHLIKDLIWKHHGKDGDIVSFELYCDLLRLPILMERHEEGIYFEASEFFGSIGDEKRQRLALTKTAEHRDDIFFEDLEALDRKKGNSLTFLEDEICFALRTGDYKKLGYHLEHLPEKIQR